MFIKNKLRKVVATSIRALWKMFVTASPSLSVISVKLARLMTIMMVMTMVMVVVVMMMKLTRLVSNASVTPSLVNACTKLVWKLAVKLERNKRCHDWNSWSTRTLGG